MTPAVATDRPPPDQVLVDMADYAVGTVIESPAAYAAARLCLMDSLGFALLALDDPDCARLLGPVVPGAELPGGARVPGTAWELDPVQAAFNLGAMIRWLDYNDTWLAAEWGHPSDNLGAILALRRLGEPATGRGRPGAAPRPRPADGHDQGLRNPRRHCPGERLQPGGARSRAAGPRGQHGRGHGPAGRIAPAAARRAFERLDRRRLPADLPSRARTRARGSRGRRATPPAAACGWRFGPCKARWVIPRR